MTGGLFSYFDISYYHNFITTELACMRQKFFRDLIESHSKWKDNFLPRLSVWLHHSHPCLLDKPILCFLSCGVTFLAPNQFGFLGCFLSKSSNAKFHLRCCHLSNTRQMLLFFGFKESEIFLAIQKILTWQMRRPKRPAWVF